jgi:selenocysteine lyase/cysteine desulfurase
VYSASMGTRNIPQILGHGLAMDFHTSVGHDRIIRRCRELSVVLRDELNGNPSLELLSPSEGELSSAMVSCRIRGPNRSQVVRQLATAHSIIVKDLPPTYSAGDGMSREDYNAIRLSTHIFNNEEQIARAADILQSLLGK